MSLDRKAKRVAKILESEFCQSKSPFSAATASSLIGINASDTNGLLRDMTERNLLTKIENNSKQGTVTRYVFKTPARKWLSKKW
jgi:Fic family protein